METLEISKKLILELSKEIEKIDIIFKNNVDEETKLDLIDNIEKISIIKDIKNNQYLLSSRIINEFFLNTKIIPDFIVIDNTEKVVRIITYKLATFLNSDDMIDQIISFLNELEKNGFEFELNYFHLGEESELKDIKYKENIINIKEFSNILKIKEKLIEKRMNQEAKLTSQYLVKELED